MPKVILTEAQRRKQRHERRSQLLADGLAAYKTRNRLTNEALAAELSIGKNTITRLLSGGDVRLSIMAYWRLLEIAGLEAKQKGV